MLNLPPEFSSIYEHPATYSVSDIKGLNMIICSYILLNMPLKSFRLPMIVHFFPFCFDHVTI